MKPERLELDLIPDKTCFYVWLCRCGTFDVFVSFEKSTAGIAEKRTTVQVSDTTKAE